MTIHKQKHLHYFQRRWSCTSLKKVIFQGRHFTLLTKVRSVFVCLNVYYKFFSKFQRKQNTARCRAKLILPHYFSKVVNVDSGCSKLRYMYFKLFLRFAACDIFFQTISHCIFTKQTANGGLSRFTLKQVVKGSRQSCI